MSLSTRDEAPCDIITTATRARVELLADKGYQGADGTITHPHKGRRLTAAQKQHNRMVNSVCGPGERGFAVLKAWRILTVATADGRVSSRMLGLGCWPTSPTPWA